MQTESQSHVLEEVKWMDLDLGSGGGMRLRREVLQNG